MASTKAPTEADIVFNRASVALAKSQRLIASWLPPRSDEETASAKTEEQLEQEEKEIFAPVPELLGVGAPLPKDVAEGSLNRRKISSNDKLLQQLLGKKAAKERMQAAQKSSKIATASPKPTAQTKPARADDSSDEEESRSSAFKSKKSKAKSQKVQPARSAEESGSKPEEHEVSGPAEQKDAEEETKAKVEPSNPEDTLKKKKRPASILDDILAERSRKKKKKNKNPAGGDN